MNIAVGQVSVSARRSIDSLLENTLHTESQTEDDIVAESVEMRSPCMFNQTWPVQ